MLAIRQIGQAIGDRHAKHDVVILGFDVVAGEKLEDCVADRELISPSQTTLAQSLRLVVHERAVRRLEIEQVQPIGALLDARVTTRDAVARQDDVVVASAADRNGWQTEEIATPELRLQRRINDDETVLARALDLELIETRHTGLQIVVGVHGVRTSYRGGQA